MSTSRTDSFNQVEEQWFYADSNRTPQGPFSFPDLQRLKAEGTITFKTLVIAQGAEEWVPYSRVAPPKLPPLSSPPPLQRETAQQKDGVKGKKNAIRSAVDACSSRKWVVVLFLFLFCPLGLLLLWKGSAFDRPIKKLLTAVVLPLYLLLFISNTPTTAVTYHLSLGLVLFMIAAIRIYQTKTLWFYMDANQNAVGPVTFGEIFKLTIKRKIPYEALILPEGGDQWVPFTNAGSVRRKCIASTKIDWFTRSAVLPCLVFLALIGITNSSHLES